MNGENVESIIFPNILLRMNKKMSAKLFEVNTQDNLWKGSFSQHKREQRRLEENNVHWRLTEKKLDPYMFSILIDAWWILSQNLGSNL